MEILLFAAAVILFIVSAFADSRPPEALGARWGSTLQSLGLAAFAGAFLQPLL
jgi:hypothetical protein